MRGRWPARASGPPPAATASPGVGKTSSSIPLDELERLAALRDAGALDADEFARQKQRLLE
jgi:hypothetical protein